MKATIRRSPTEYGKLEQEAGDLKARSELISTAILNAEKCAGKLIDDANERANDMITDAKDKVDAETKSSIPLSSI